MPQSIPTALGNQPINATPNFLYLPLISKYYPPDFIAFYANWWGTNDIFLVDSNGQAWTRLIGDSSDDRFPTWSPDGQQLAFASDRLPGNQLIRTDRPTGSTGFNVFIANADGTGIFQLTSKPEGACDADPDWSPDGTQVAYTSCEPGPKKIFTIRLSDRKVTQVTYGPDWDHMPAWSPDSKKLVFWRFKAGSSDIYTIHADGSNEKQLTFTATDENDPDWSPDGQKIVFSSYRNGNSDLFIMNPDGSSEWNLTNTHPLVEFYPTWSPDGQWIAFCGVEPNVYMAIEKIRPDGSGRKRLTWMGGLQCEPDWKP